MIYFKMIALALSQKENINRFLYKLKSENIGFFTFYKFKNECFHFPDTRFPLYVFVFSLVTFLLVMLFQFWIASLFYPQNLSGKPNFHWNVAIPVSFEISLLVASILIILRLFFVLKHNNSSIPNKVLQNLQLFSNYFVLIIIDSNDLTIINQFAEKCFGDISKIEIKEIG